MRTAILISALLALALATGCRHMPGGGPLRQDWMDIIKRDRSWLIHNYDHPHRYCYQATAWSPMVPSGCGAWCPALGADPCLLPPVGPHGEIIEPGTVEGIPVPNAEAPSLGDGLPPENPAGSAPPPAAELPGASDELYLDPAPPLNDQSHWVAPRTYEEPADNASTLRIVPAYFAEPIASSQTSTIFRLPQISSAPQ